MADKGQEKVLIIDFGSQYKELIARRVREAGVPFIFRSYEITVQEVIELNPIGIIFTGGPNSVYKENSPKIDKGITELGIPILGICYGMQLLCHTLGGRVVRCDKSEYGIIDCALDTSDKLFKGLNPNGRVLMNHTDMASVLPENSIVLASTSLCVNSAFKMKDMDIYGVQFHPEVETSMEGGKMISNFLYNVCNAHRCSIEEDETSSIVKKIRDEVKDKRVLLALSGGVSSSVCAVLLEKAIPNQFICVHVNTGLENSEKGENLAILDTLDIRCIRIDARNRFFFALKRVSEPEKKRKIIGKLFIDIYKEVAKNLGEKVDYLAQGTLYSNVVESGGNGSAVIKSHHNVGGPPKKIPFKLLEPLRHLFKDDVRRLGRELALPSSIIHCQPFPGIGLATRIIGRVTEEKISILRKADLIVKEEISLSEENPDQYFAILTQDKSVGVMGDGRTYSHAVVIRAVKSTDYMTCEIYPLPISLLKKISTRITNEVKGVNRVVFDVTSKPPSTIEWE